ncbi:hypothetical protein [Fulvimarina sp. MAC3]|uniref:hypothetical protein n=1 Tax=Fulvimarina sp. MAC3 TaxID=3148887 RepID=UPI0031FE2130
MLTSHGKSHVACVLGRESKMPWELIAVSVVCCAAAFKLRVGAFVVFLAMLLAAKIAVTLVTGGSVLDIFLLFVTAQGAYAIGLVVATWMSGRHVGTAKSNQAKTWIGDPSDSSREPNSEQPSR